MPGRVVLMVSCVVAAAPPGVTVVGLNTHVLCDGRPIQEKTIAVLKLPPDGVAVMVTGALGVPRVTVTALGFAP